MKGLCLDIGNTRSKYALVENGVITQDGILPEDELFIFLRNHQSAVDYIVYSTVRSSNEQFNAALASYKKSIELQHEMPLPVRINYATSNTLGKDRIALACAAWQQFPQQNTLVIALGTCITYNFIDEQGNFVGGAISPGWRMRHQAMNHFTHKLPLVTQKDSEQLYATSTEQNLQVGAFLGMLYEIDGFINAYRLQFKEINVVLTGGDMPQFAARLKSKIFADSIFLLRGLQSIAHHNLTT